MATTMIGKTTSHQEQVKAKVWKMNDWVKEPWAWACLSPGCAEVGWDHTSHAEAVEIASDHIREHHCQGGQR